MNPKQLQKMMQQAQKMQADVQKAQSEIEAKEFTNTAGGGAIELVMTGDKKIVSLNIKEEVIDPEDKEMLEGMIVSLINQTIDQIDNETQETLGAFTKGLPF